MGNEEVLWDRDDHTRAKHQVLRAYLDAWIPIMGYQALKVRRGDSNGARLLLVDGFAGPGRYATGESGSPLIMLEALLEHQAFPDLRLVRFLFLFIEHDDRRVAHLEGEIEGLELPPNVLVQVENGEFEENFGSLVETVQERGRQLVPTFAFIDPFGYSKAPMSLAGRFLDFPQCEALIFLPLSFIHRFVGREGQEVALTSLFGSDDWKQAKALRGAARREFLLRLFEDRLASQGKARYVWSFELRTKDGNDYRLVYATGHRSGLAAMKRALWKVDPQEGTRYVARTRSGQEVLFNSGSTVNTDPLLAQLRDTLGTDWFTVADAEEVTLLETPYVPSSHLKQLTLKPAERAGTLEVQRSPGARAGSFSAEADVRMRFT